MEYDDFTIEIRPGAEGGFEARMLGGPGGRAEGALVLPASVEDAARLLARLEKGLLRSSGQDSGPSGGADGGEDNGALAGIEAVKAELGLPLFSALFDAARALRLYEALVRMNVAAASDEERGLRIRLVFGGARREDEPYGFTEQLTRLAALPWEVVCDPRTEKFLSRDLFTPVVRSPELDFADRPLVVHQPLRVLLVEALPEDCTPLDLETEAKNVKAALGAQPAALAAGSPGAQVETTGAEEARNEQPSAGAQLDTSLRGEYVASVDFLPHASFSATCDRLREGRYHVLHFMGHGGFRDGRGYLVFENPPGKAERVPAQVLEEYLSDVKTLRLVVLNACKGGRLPRIEGHDPFRAVAAALTRAGVPLLVAMQFSISDGAAIAFSEEFYRSLRNGLPVEAAVAAGRRAIWRRNTETLEWITPVLYMKSKEGRLLRTDQLAARHRDDEDVVQPLRLGIRTFVEDPKRPHLAQWAKDINLTTDLMLSLHPYFEHRFIRDPALWAEAVFPELRRFLADALTERRPLVFEMPAHSTVAFATGYFLEAKSGFPVTIRQRGMRGIEDWTAVAGEEPAPPLWAESTEEVLDSSAPDLALAVGLANPILADVRKYLGSGGSPLGKLVGIEIHPGAGQMQVASGRHAFALAQELRNRIKAWKPEPAAGLVHLFVSGPNAFLFFLGQLWRALGPVQLYEHDFEATRGGSYQPSLLLPPDEA